jgi:uncharacterized membrane protein (UPF0127 family)
MVNTTNGQVYVYNKTREAFLATEARVADGYFSRLVGLLGKTRRWARAGRGLWIVPSHGVHTIGMLFAIDVIFLDRDKKVVHVEEYVRPFRISKVSLKTSTVLELPPHTIFRTGTQAGDVLEIERLGSASLGSAVRPPMSRGGHEADARDRSRNSADPDSTRDTNRERRANAALSSLG